MPVGTGGATGTGGDTNVPMDRGVSGGCACDTAGSGSAPGLASALLLALGFAVTFARPRVRAPRARVPRVRA